MKCPRCGDEGVVPGSKFCPNCGWNLQSPAPTPAPAAQITSAINLGSAAGGTVRGVEIGQVGGSVTVQSTINEIESRLAGRDYVDQRTITNNFLVLNDPAAIDEIVRRVAELTGAGGFRPGNAGAPPPENVSRQIEQLVAAQKEAAAQGLAPSADGLAQLGMMAAYRRDYVTALDYAQQALRLDPTHTQARHNLAWVCQILAREELARGQTDAAVLRLEQARGALAGDGTKDAEGQAVLGYVAQLQAQVAEASGSAAERKRYYAEAAAAFGRAAQLDPENPSAQNGLGNVQLALGNLDEAIGALSRVVVLAPTYGEAYNDLALALEGKWRADPRGDKEWCLKALKAWEKTLPLAETDPTFTQDHVEAIRKRIRWLKKECRGHEKDRAH